MRTGHPDHIQHPIRNRMACCRHIRNLCRMKRRHPCQTPHLTRKIQMRGRGHTLYRNNPRQSGIRMNAPTDHIQEIHHTAVPQHLGNFKTILCCDPAFIRLIRRIPNANDKLRTNPFTDCCQHI